MVSRASPSRLDLSQPVDMKKVVEPMERREQVAEFWDEAINRFLAGEFPQEPPLDTWMASYRGAGQGVVDFEAYPEPYHGNILGDVKAVKLALNPGTPVPEFHYRHGWYAQEIRELGSFRRFNEQGGSRYDHIWYEKVGPPSHRDVRLTFAQRWLGLSSLTKDQLLTFELYPWHSRRVIGDMAPPPSVIREFVLEPIAETGVKHAWAFGAPWFRVLDRIGLKRVVTLGKEGEKYSSAVESRSVAVFEGLGGTLICVEKHSGSAGPPSASETELLKEEFRKRDLYPEDPDRDV